MIGVVDVKIQAANPSMPLYPMRAFIGSPSSIRVREVPKKIGDWQITKVYFTAEYPDDSIKTAECVLVGGVYVGTIAGSSVAGSAENGYTIFADGIDEKGNDVHGYVLGKGDIQILEADSTITPSEGGTKYYVHLLSAQAATLNEGDMWQDGGSWYIWQDGQAWAIGDESGLIGQLSAELSAKQDKLSELQMSAINSVVDERETVVTYLDSSISSFNIVGELNGNSISGRNNVADIKIGTGVTSIGDNAFLNCTGLTSVTIPDSVTSIGNQAFSYCTSLTNVTIGNSVTSVGEGAFWGCSGLTSVTIPYGVTSIGDYAFYNCTGLTSAVIPDSVTSIGDSAFDGCSSLKTVFLPKILVNSGSTIGTDAFSGTNSNIIIYFKDAGSDVLPYLANYPWGVDTSAIQTWNDASQEWVKEQGYASTYPYANVFIAPFGVRSATLQPYKINQLTIASQAASFRVDVGGSTGNMRDLYFALTVPTDAQPMTWNTYFDKFTGGDATAIAPKSGVNIYHIYEYASGHFAVEKFDNAQSKLSDAQMAIINNAAEEAKTVVTYRDGTISKLDIAGVIEDSRVIPNLAEVVEIKFGNTVTQLMKEQYGSEDDRYTFSACPYLSSATIPDSVKLIGEQAFANCANLTSVTFGNGVTSIGQAVFEYCSGLTSVTIPNSVTSIGDYAFRNCIGLTSVTIPNSVTNIGQYAFSGCTSLTHVVAREAGSRSFYGCTSLQSVEIYSGIGWEAFAGCTGLTDVTMYDGVDIIGASAFEGCTALVNVQFSDRLNVIRFQAFKGCTSLVRINLPDSLTSIQQNAFENCTSLHELNVGNSLQTIGAEAFKNCLTLNDFQYVYLPATIQSIGADAFATNSTGTTLVFIDGNASNISSLPNYPWGIQFTARIMTFHDASQEWVKEQAYGQQYGFKTGNITPRPPRLMNLTPYKVTTFTVGSATNPFTITPTGDAGNMRDYYLSLTLNVATSVMWASSIDVFKGGDASALAPVIGVNIYHILEYISGHFMVEKMV